MEMYTKVFYRASDKDETQDQIIGRLERGYWRAPSGTDSKRVAEQAPTADEAKWLELALKQPDIFDRSELSEAKVGSMWPAIVGSKRAILLRESADTWATLHLDGHKGQHSHAIINSASWWHPPSVEEVEAALSELQSAQDEGASSSATPKRQKLRDGAYAHLQKQAQEMRQRAKAKHGVVDVGTVVQVALADVDRGKLDDPNLTVVVVECVMTGTVQKEVKYRLAGLAGKIKTLYTRSYIKPLKTTPLAMGLQKVLEEWQGMPEAGLRENAKLASQTGGQGHVHCSCKGACDKATCSCFKAGRKCNSRCHKGNKKCKNHD